MQNITKIPVTIITGFLGSGKTTLISQLMKNPLGKRLAVIVNEFGDVGVDGEILRGCAIPNCPEENIMELANGCICCTVADDFIPTIEVLMSLSPQPEHILIENNNNLILCERGVSIPHTHKDTSRFALDIQAIPALKEICN